LALALACAAAHAGIGIRIEGNSGLSKRRLEEVIAPDPESYDKDGLRSWREDGEFYLTDLYRGFGYFDMRVHSDLKQRGTDPKDWDAVFTIEEGPRYAFDTVRVAAADLRVRDQVSLFASSDSGISPHADTAQLPLTGPPIDPDDLQARAGKPYSDDALLVDRRYILRRYGNSGFVRVAADEKVDVRPATKTVAVLYRIDAGLPVIFDTVLIRNMRAPPADTLPGITRESKLSGLIPYARNDTVRLSGNEKVVEKLQYTGVFNYVRLKDSLREDGSGRSALYLYTEERVPGNIRSSIFYETQYGPGVSADARHSNVAGTMNELRTGFSLAKDRQDIYGGYGSPLTHGLLIRFDDDLTFDWYQDKPVHNGLGPFDGDFRGVNSARLTWPWKYWLRLVGDAQIESQSRLVGADERDRSLSLNFIQTAFLNFVNQPMDPTRGLRFAFTWGNGGPLFRDEAWRFAEFRHNWLEAQTSQYYYLPELRMIKLATRLDGGRFFGAGGPNSNRFFLGGSRSVRSYDFQTLCPEKSATGVCVDNDETLAYFLVSGEVRLEPFWFIRPQSKLKWASPFQIVSFADFGKVWDIPDGFTLEEPDGSLPPGQGYALGLGVRYPLLGIFNLRMDWSLWRSGPKLFWLDLAQAF
jgi:outer membrane protein assembly factor BamA